MIDFLCQHEALATLDDLVAADRHSILIEGPQGCGKSFLAKEFSRRKNIPDIQFIAPTVDDVKSTVQEFYSIQNKSIVVIENLDCGVPGASYALLKFLEEPTSNAYVIVTCRNIKKIPDTIISRSAVISCSPPNDHDIDVYAEHKDSTGYNIKKDTLVWKAVKSFSDADVVLGMTLDQTSYFNMLVQKLPFRDKVSQLMWDIGHYPDSSELPLELALRCFMICGSHSVRNAAIECLNDLALNRIAKHAVLARFCFAAKYNA